MSFLLFEVSAISTLGDHIVNLTVSAGAQRRSFYTKLIIWMIFPILLAACLFIFFYAVSRHRGEMFFGKRGQMREKHTYKDKFIVTLNVALYLVYQLSAQTHSAYLTVGKLVFMNIFVLILTNSALLTSILLFCLQSDYHKPSFTFWAYHYQLLFLARNKTKLHHSQITLTRGGSSSYRIKRKGSIGRCHHL